MTQNLQGPGAGGRQAAEDLIPLVYEQLCKLAAWRIGRELVPNIMQASALVNEAYLKLSPGENKWDNRRHFMAAAGEAMRRILVDRARRRKAVIHGGDLRRTELVEERVVAPPRNHDDHLAVHEILERFAEFEPRKAEVVKLRYFLGMTVDETAEELGISAPTARRDWAYARAWLFRQLTSEADACG